MMILKKFEFLGLFLMFFHWMVLRVFAARHGMDVGWIEGSNLDEQSKMRLLQVEQMWRDCGIDLVAIKEEVHKSGAHLSKDIFLESAKISTRTELLAEGTMHEALILLPHDSFLDCLIKQNYPLDKSSEENLRIWLAYYLDSLLNQLHIRRRFLVARDYEDMSPSVAPYLPSDIDLTLPIEPTSEPTPPKKVPGSPSKKSTLQESHDPPPPNNEVNVKDAIFITVIMTAVLTATFVALLLFCYVSCKEKSRYSGYGRKDVFSLSLSDFSDSSQKSFGNGSSLLAPPKPLKTDPTYQNIQVSSTDSSVETQSSKILHGNSNSSDEQSNVITGDTSLSKSPPPPPEVPTPLDKPSPPPPPKVGPPPPLKGATPPRPPQAKLNILRPHKPPPLVPKQPGEAVDVVDDSDAPKTKLKPFFWDKVQANPAQSMVWDRLKAGSFQFNEEMIENLFAYNDKNKEGKKVLSAKDAGPQYVRILDPKKSQNLAISLKALNVKSEEVREALMEGNELPPELLHTLLKMAPTTEEELKIRLHADPTQLGPAEQFIRTIVNVPFAFQRVDALLFMTSLQEESSSISKAFSILDVACKELRSSRLFLKLLEAVLKTGNRMNDGTYRGRAQAFKLDTLLKLSDVRGTDGKTTLLHFVVLEIIRTEGIRASHTTGESRSSVSSLYSEDLFDDPPADSGDCYHSLGYKVVSGLSDELEHVKKAAGLDADTLTNNLASLSERLAKTRDFLKTKMEGIDEGSQFLQLLRGFVEHAEAVINSLLEEEKKIRSLVKHTTDYFHGNSGQDEGLRMFVIVRDFLAMIDKVCKEVKVLPKPTSKTQISRVTTPAISPARDHRQLLFPAIKDRRMDSSDSSDDDN